MTELLIAGAGRGFDLRGGEYTDLRKFAQLLLLLGIRARLMPCYASPSAMAGQLLRMAHGCEYIIIAGRMFPPDERDIAKEAIREGFGWPFHQNEELFLKLKEKLPDGDIAARLSYLPSGCRLLENRLGKAPGFSLSIKDSTVIVLPHAPDEFFDMLDTCVLPMLARASGKSLARIGVVSENIDPLLLEPLLEELLDEFLDSGKPPADFHFLGLGDGKLRITVTTCAAGDSEAAKLAEEYASSMAALLPAATVKPAPPAGDIPNPTQCGKVKAALAATGTKLISRILSAIPGVFDYTADSQPDDVREKVFSVPRQYAHKDGGVNTESAVCIASRLMDIYGADIGFSVIYDENYPMAAMAVCREGREAPRLISVPQDIPEDGRLDFIGENAENFFRESIDCFNKA